jgi:hypothetical protein
MLPLPARSWKHFDDSGNLPIALISRRKTRFARKTGTVFQVDIQKQPITTWRAIVDLVYQVTYD